MKLIKLALLLCLLTAAVTACSAASSEQRAEQTLRQQLFPQDKVGEVRLNIAAADYKAMLDNPLAEQYKAATIEYNGHRLTHIAVRTKGNSSLNSVARTDSDRYSLKLSFDQYISQQQLFGVKTINLNNNFSDPTFLREFLSYELFRKMGVPVPEYAFVNLYINDELIGLFLAVEQIEEPYLQRHFGQSHGALYKPDGEGSDLLWKGDDIAAYSGLNLKSKSDGANAMLDMLNELNNGGDYERVLDVDGVLRYLAVSTVLVNLDSYQGNLKHNYYLYEKDGRFSILPWDLNMSFAGFTMGSNQQNSAQLLIDEPTMGAVAERPLIDKLLQVEAYREAYHRYIAELIDNDLQPDRFEQRVLELSQLISPHVEQDPTKFYTYEDHLRALYDDVQNVPGLISFVRQRTANVRQQLDGTLPSSGTGAGLGTIPGRGNMNFGGGMQGGRQQGGFPRGQEQGAFAAEPGQEQLPRAGNFPPGQGQFPQEGNFPPNQGGPPLQGGNFPGAPFNAASPPTASIDPQREAALAAGALGVLLLSGCFIAFYRRRQL